MSAVEDTPYLYPVRVTNYLTLEKRQAALNVEKALRDTRTAQLELADPVLRKTRIAHKRGEEFGNHVRTDSLSFNWFGL